MTNEQFTQAVDRHMDTVYRIALQYCRDPAAAEDVSQEVFLRLFRSRTAFLDEDHLKFWLIRVAVNESKRALAAPWRRTEPLEEQAEPAAPSDEENRALYALVMGLPRKYRVVIYLYYYEGYQTGEIARLLRLPAATVRTQLDRGRKLLKERLLEAEHV
ncbi:MAG: sigma-70 family RNA polymerase sigma factor [Oscillospiraceae bacterium]|nr:sigma-70 family RNA polymerase sigma factor [Oscillospiraceae bacterium]